jgi:hypothetical protein
MQSTVISLIDFLLVEAKTILLASFVVVFSPYTPHPGAQFIAAVILACGIFRQAAVCSLAQKYLACIPPDLYRAVAGFRSEVRRWQGYDSIPHAGATVALHALIHPPYPNLSCPHGSPAKGASAPVLYLLRFQRRVTL